MTVEFVGGPRDGETVALHEPHPRNGTWLPPRNMHFAPTAADYTATRLKAAMEPILLHTYALAPGRELGDYHYVYQGMELL